MLPLRGSMAPGSGAGLVSKRKVGHGFVFVPVEDLEERLRKRPGEAAD